MHNSLKLLRLMVRKLLEHPHEHHWSIQRLGMLRLYLEPQVRLHIWLPREPHKREGVSELHNHPWHFYGTVIAGWVNNHIYRPAPNDYHPKNETWMSGTIECGPNPSKCGAHDIKEIKLLPDKQAIRTGETYYMDARTIHRSEMCPGTVTIIQRTPLEDPDHARVCWPVGEEWVSAEPRDATKDEVEAFVAAAWQRMDIEDKGLTY